MENIRRPQFVARLIFLITVVCFNCDSRNAEESGREKTIRLLTSNSFKQWAVDEVTENGIVQTISRCDSVYLLTLQTDLRWQETYKYLLCPQKSEGSWDLNEENNVITIEYFSWQSGSLERKDFVIVDLTEEVFAYEVAIRNNLKLVRLKAH